MGFFHNSLIGVITAAALALSAAGCRLVESTETVVVTLPPLPAQWQEAWGPAGYEIVWRSHFSAHGSLNVETGQTRVALALPRGSVVAVLAYPVWQSGGPFLPAADRMRPAGAVWAPADPGLLAGAGVGVVADQRSLALSFEEGPVALVLSEAARRGADIQQFNHRRLSAELAARIPEDPWLLDCERVIRAVCERSMRVSYVREIERHEVTLEFPDGLWMEASPFAAVIPGGQDPVASGRTTRSFPEGITPLYSANGRRLIAEIDEEGRGWCGFSPAP